MTNPTAVAQHTNAPVNLLGCSVADLHNTVAARKSHSNWNSQPARMWDTDLCTLKFKG